MSPRFPSRMGNCDDPECGKTGESRPSSCRFGFGIGNAVEANPEIFFFETGYCSHEFEINGIPTLRTVREDLISEEGDFVRISVLEMMHPIDSTFGNSVANVETRLLWTVVLVGRRHDKNVTAGLTHPYRLPARFQCRC